MIHHIFYISTKVIYMGVLYPTNYQIFMECIFEESLYQWVNENFIIFIFLSIDFFSIIIWGKEKYDDLAVYFTINTQKIKKELHE